MNQPSVQKPLTIFIHRASELVTDHETHGEGLICFSLLKGLAERGHRLHTCTSQTAIRDLPPSVLLYELPKRLPANSLAPWEFAYGASRHLRRLMTDEKIDLVWHMNPCGSSGCPAAPHTFDLPLVVGPIYYPWPDTPGVRQTTGQPRLGLGLQPLLNPISKRGWKQTLDQSAVIFFATAPHAEMMQKQLPHAAVYDLPLIVEPPHPIPPKQTRFPKTITLLFAANLVPSKNPMVFCETIVYLRQSGIAAEGIILGDGLERSPLETFCRQQGLQSVVCFRGKVPNATVYEHLQDADFLLSTSLGEPYGRGIAEAMSVGTPAACHYSGGPADFISDGKDGLLVSELTGAAYAEKIKNVLAEPSAYGLLSENARLKAQQWTSEAVITRLEGALRKACR